MENPYPMRGDYLLNLIHPLQTKHSRSIKFTYTPADPARAFHIRKTWQRFPWKTH